MELTGNEFKSTIVLDDDDFEKAILDYVAKKYDFPPCNIKPTVSLRPGIEVMKNAISIVLGIPFPLHKIHKLPHDRAEAASNEIPLSLEPRAPKEVYCHACSIAGGARKAVYHKLPTCGIERKVCMAATLYKNRKGEITC